MARRGALAVLAGPARAVYGMFLPHGVIKPVLTCRTGKKGFDSNADQNISVFADTTVHACTYDNAVHAIDGETGQANGFLTPSPAAPSPCAAVA